MKLSKVCFRRWRGLALLAGAVFSCSAGCYAAGCPTGQFEGEVRSGTGFSHRISPTQQLLLESLPSGWIMRVLPVSGERPAHDSAELATPPYRSPNPLLLSTDFAFRAQDAIAWNPRAFHFFTTAEQIATASTAYEATRREPNRPAAGAALFPLLASACSGEFRILDARIAGGTNDQNAMAAAVASHFSETAHTVDSQSPPSKLGRVEWVRFRVTLQGPGGTHSRH